MTVKGELSEEDFLPDPEDDEDFDDLPPPEEELDGKPLICAPRQFE